MTRAETLSVADTFPQNISSEASPLTTSPEDLIRSGIETERLEDIQVNRLLLEESVIDEDHRDKLKDSMRGKRGQISPIVVRARFDEQGLVVYDVIDGFHRGAALKCIGEEDKQAILAHAVVVYGCSDEELYDLRVLAVNSVKGVSFPRLINWMQRSFEQTPWYAKGLTLSQILSLAYQDGSGLILKLTPEEAYEAKQWALSKANKWNKPLASIYQDTRAAENADPEIIKLVRVGGGGTHDKRGTLNPARFRAMVEELPGEYDLQWLMVRTISKFNLDQTQTRRVAREVAKARDNPEALELIEIDPISTIGEFSNEDEDHDRSDIPESTPVQNTSKKRKYTIGKSNSSLNGYFVEKSEDHETARLREALSTAHEQLEKRSIGGNPIWYATIPDLSPLEQRISHLFFGKGMNVDDIAYTMNMLPHKVFQALQSTTVKYQLEQEKITLLEEIASTKQ